MSLIVLLVMTLSALVSVESYSSRANLDVALARQNAFVGLMSGISALQSAAGPDQRVTATADILNGSAASNKAWTGVWKSDGVSNYTASSPVWLVSGARPNPSTSVPLPASGNGIVLMRTAFTGLNNETHEAVRVPRAPMMPAGQVASSGASNAPTAAASGNDGYYAYWVSDEGVKAKVNIASEPTEAVQTNTYASAVLPVANGIQFLEGLSGWSTVSTSQMDRMDGLRSLNYLTGFSGSTVSTKAQNDLTADSVGLLTDVRNGGLRLDLTAAFGSDSIFSGFFENSADKRNYYLLYYSAERLGDSTLDKFKAVGPRLSLLRDYARFYNNIDNGGVVTTELDSSIVDNGGGGDLSQYPRVLGRIPYDKQKSGEILNQFVADSGSVSFNKNILVPVIASYQFGLRLRPNVGRPITVTTGVFEYPLQAETQMFVGFYNPYNVTISLAPRGLNYLRLQSIIYPYVNLRLTRTNTIGASVSTDYWIDGCYHMQLIAQDDGKSSYAHQCRFNSIVVPPGQIRMYGVAQRSSANSTMSNSFNPNAYQINPNSGSLSASTSINSTASGLLRVREGDMVEILAASPVPPPDYKGWRLMADYQLRFSLTTQTYLFYNSLSPIWYTDLREGYNSQTWRSITRAPMEITRLGSGGAFNPIEIGAWGFNLRHTRSDMGTRVIFDNNVRTLYSTSFADKSSSIAIPSMYEYSQGSTTVGTPEETWGYVSYDACTPPQISGTADARSWWGNVSPSSITGGSGADTVILFDMARCPPLSVGTFQHACLGLYSNEPSYVAGNSYANRRIDQRELYASNGGDICAYDISYLVNDALWDAYFFSGLERNGGNKGGVRWDSWNSQNMLLDHVENPQEHPLPNPRLYIDKSLSKGQVNVSDFFSESSANDYAGFRNIASMLRVNGPFNVNSTSTQAWKALLMSMSDAELPVLNPVGGNITRENVGGTQTAFPRMSFSGGDKYDGGGGDNFWKGFRVLSEDEATRLAEKIVEQVRLRGPFRSMADFVNRRLVSGDLGVSGALQSAIDEARLNYGIPSTFSENAKSVNGWNSAPDNTKTGDGFPGAIMQGDILQALAPVLTARSDTFRIRAYGDVISPSSGEVTAKAYCEAVIQRVPEYCDATDDSYKGARMVSGYGDTLSDVNRTMGRRFKIVSFRWLSPNEI